MIHETVMPEREDRTQQRGSRWQSEHQGEYRQRSSAANVGKTSTMHILHISRAVAGAIFLATSSKDLHHSSTIITFPSLMLTTFCRSSLLSVATFPASHIGWPTAIATRFPRTLTQTRRRQSCWKEKRPSFPLFPPRACLLGETAPGLRTLGPETPSPRLRFRERRGGTQPFRV